VSRHLFPSPQPFVVHWWSNSRGPKKRSPEVESSLVLDTRHLFSGRGDTSLSLGLPSDRERFTEVLRDFRRKGWF